MGRVVMRNPKAAGWPEKGERTELREIAERWKWAYVSYARGEHRARVLNLPGREPPIRDLIPAYLEQRREVVASSTWEGDQTASVYLVEAFGSEKPASVTTESVQAWVTSMIRQGYRGTTIRQYLTSMRVFFRAHGHDPTKDVQLPAPGRQDVRWWSDAEVDALREVADGPARLVIEIGVSMGLRQGEIFGLRWEDIRENDRAVRVDRQTIRNRSGTKPLKGKLSRTALVLPEWWAHHRRATGWVIGPMGYTSQRELISDVLDRAGLNGMGVGFHSLRHTYAARYLMAGGSIFGLQKSLGHSSVKVTEQSYSHLASDTVVEIEARSVYRSA